MRFILFCFLSILINCFAVRAQTDSAKSRRYASERLIKAQIMNAVMQDSITRLNREAFLDDSVAKAFIFPDSLREDQFITGLLRYNLSDLLSTQGLNFGHKTYARSGILRVQRETWVIAALIGLLIYTGLLNFFFSSDIKNVIQSFYKKNARSQSDKDGVQVGWWAVIGLFILFSMAFGLVLYQYTLYKNMYHSISGFQLFISLSVLVSLLFVVKYLVLRFLGFIFDIGKLVGQYIAILNLTYFNIGFLLLGTSICFSMLSAQYLGLLLNFTLLAIAVIFAWQYVLNSVSIISNFRFHKFYLFVYLCALEICPILILIKALDI
jgi:hypothetical protein